MENAEKIKDLIESQAMDGIATHSSRAAMEAAALSPDQKLKLVVSLTITNDGIIAIDGAAKLDKVESDKSEIDCLTFDPNQPDLPGIENGPKI